VIFVSKNDELLQGQCNLQVEPEWHARIMRQAKRAGMDVSDYIGQGTILKLEEDEATDSDLQKERGWMITGHCQVGELGEHQLATPPDTHDKVVPPLKWHGGKYYLFKTILALMPPHLHYVEPFFGGGQVLFGRDPADRSLWWPERTSDGREVDGVSEVVNDIDANLMNFYQVLRDPSLFEKLQHRLELMQFSEAE